MIKLCFASKRIDKGGIFVVVFFGEVTLLLLKL